MTTFISGLKNWITSTGGFLLIIHAISVALVALSDQDATTNPDWNIFVVEFTTGLVAIFTRDADKSSEDSGIK